MRHPYAYYLDEATSEKIVQMRNCPHVLEKTGLAKLKSNSKYGYSMDWPNLKTSSDYQFAPTDAYGGTTYRLNMIAKPAEFLLLTETDGSYYRVRSGNLKGMVSSILDRHSVGVNVLRADQHVDFVTCDTIARQSALPDDQDTWFRPTDYSFSRRKSRANYRMGKLFRLAVLDIHCRTLNLQRICFRI